MVKAGLQLLPRASCGSDTTDFQVGKPLLDFVLKHSSTDYTADTLDAISSRQGDAAAAVAEEGLEPDEIATEAIVHACSAHASDACTCHTATFAIMCTYTATHAHRRMRGCMRTRQTSTMIMMQMARSGS